MEWVWSFSVYNFNIPDEQFWRMTMREFAHLMERHNEHQETENFRMGLIVATLYNVNLEKFERTKPFTVTEILGIDEEMDMQETAEMWTQVMGGVLNE